MQLETVIELKKAFKVDIMPITRQAIREETGKVFQRSCRIEYLKACMTQRIVEVWQLIDQYEDYKKRERTVERLLTGERLQATAKEIATLQGQIIALRCNANTLTQITPDQITQAKAYLFESLINFKRNSANCPFHKDRLPSMHLYRDSNTVHCFSCGRSFDTIGFIRERDGLSFQEAVKALQ